MILKLSTTLYLSLTNLCYNSFRNSNLVLYFNAILNDLPYVFSMDHFIVNKFILSDEPVTYQCLEEFYEYKIRNKPIINYDIYFSVLKKYSNISLCN